MLNAVSMAGLNCLRLMNDTTAGMERPLLFVNQAV